MRDDRLEHPFRGVEAPARLSSRRAASLLHLRETGGCSFCFPHGTESTTPRLAKVQRSWKAHRRAQWR